MKKLFLLLIISSCTSAKCISNAEEKREEKLAEYRHQLIINKIDFSQFEELRDDVLVIEKMKKIKCEGS